MGVEDPRPKGNGGTDVTGQRGGWVLDGSGFRRVGSEETGEGRSPRVEKLPAFSLGSTGLSALAVASIGLPIVWWLLVLSGWIMLIPYGMFLLPPAAVVLGISALVQIHQSGGVLWGSVFAITGILVGAALTLLLFLAVSSGSFVPCFGCLD